MLPAPARVGSCQQDEGTFRRLHDGGVQVLPDLCWCSICERVFPTRTRAVMTNSGKYARCGPDGRAFWQSCRSLEASINGRVAARTPLWLSSYVKGKSFGRR
ncbi:aconitase X [Rhizobium herbae]|uniref:aconitase X n=1 Tax=Rhizobium herbae TaxID=508661 RepID=UPI003209C5F3